MLKCKLVENNQIGVHKKGDSECAGGEAKLPLPPVRAMLVRNSANEDWLRLHLGLLAVLYTTHGCDIFIGPKRSFLRPNVYIHTITLTFYSISFEQTVQRKNIIFSSKSEFLCSLSNKWTKSCIILFIRVRYLIQAIFLFALFRQYKRLREKVITLWELHKRVDN